MGMQRLPGHGSFLMESFLAVPFLMDSFLTRILFLHGFFSHTYFFTQSHRGREILLLYFLYRRSLRVLCGSV